MSVRLAATADLHGYLPAVSECDVLVLAGDLCPVDDHKLDHQAAWLDGPFRAWLDAAPATEVVAIAGNHDWLFEQAPERVPALRWTLLQDTSAVVGGLTFFGSPWTPWFFDWAFNAPQAGGEAFLAERWAACPADADVIVLHGPLVGYGGRTTHGPDAGSQAAVELIDRVRPQLCVYGHIHEDRGRWERGATTLANVAAVDLQYRLRAEPFMTFSAG